MTKIVLVIGLDLKPPLEAIFWDLVIKKVELWAIFYKKRENFRSALGVISCGKSGFRKKIVCIIILAAMPGYVNVKSQQDSYRGVDSTAPGSFRHFGPQLFYL